jgi:hypothetical protein
MTKKKKRYTSEEKVIILKRHLVDVKSRLIDDPIETYG